MRKRSNGSLVDERGTWTCKAGSKWPPLRLYPGGESVEQLRHSISSAEYNALKIWENTCGLFSMEAPKCFGCPNVLLDGKSLRTGSPPPPLYRRKPKKVRDT